VAVFGEDSQRLVLRQLTRCGRCKPRFFICQPPQARAITVDGIEAHLLQARLVRLLPTKIDALAVLRPIDARRLVAIQTWPAHDAVHRQLEGLRWWRLCLLRAGDQLTRQQEDDAERTRRAPESIHVHMHLSPDTER